MSRGTAPQRLIVMIDSDTSCKYWYIVVGVTIPFKGLKRGLSKIMVYFTFDSLARKLNKILPHGTAPLKLIVMIDSNTYCKYWYIVVGVHNLSQGAQEGSVKNYDIFHF